jgi:hypothetical protein
LNPHSLELGRHLLFLLLLLLLGCWRLMKSLLRRVMHLLGWRVMCWPGWHHFSSRRLFSTASLARSVSCLVNKRTFDAFPIF